MEGEGMKVEGKGKDGIEGTGRGGDERGGEGKERKVE